MLTEFRPPSHINRPKRQLYKERLKMKTQPWMLSLLFLLFISFGRLASAQAYAFSTPYSFPPATAVSPMNPSGPIIDASGNCRSLQHDWWNSGDQNCSRDPLAAVPTNVARYLASPG